MKIWTKWKRIRLLKETGKDHFSRASAKIPAQRVIKNSENPLHWIVKQYCSDWATCINREGMMQFIEHTNSHHSTIKFTAEMSETEMTVLDTSIYKGERFWNNSILDLGSHFKSIESLALYHPPGMKKGFIKGEALRILRTNSFKKTETQFEEKIQRVHQSWKHYTCKYM